MSDDDSYSMASAFDEVEEIGVVDAKVRWRCIDGDSLRQFQNEAIADVVEMLHCSRSQAMVALRHFRWDRDKLLESVGEAGKERVFTLAGAQSAASESGRPADVRIGYNSGPTTCMICMEHQAEASTMECGHTFCNECWVSHLRVKIAEGQSCAIPCMEFECRAICDDSIVSELLRSGDPEALAKYERARLQSYIEDNSMVVWCPSVPCCGRAVESLDDLYCEPVCPCGQHFCFKCAREAHSPCTCEMWEVWKEKEEGESETKHWLQANTKPCPKCSVPVEKDGGCNLVVCRSCQQCFCWLCGAKTGIAHTWEKIDGHTCGQWKEELDASIEESKARLSRYMHYFRHYSAHRDSAVKEASAEGLEEMIPRLINGCVSEIVDFAFLENGSRILAECRRVLACSYVLAYFMFGNEMFKDDFTPDSTLALKERFEDTQQTLNATVEALSAVMHNALLHYKTRLLALTEDVPDGAVLASTSSADAVTPHCKRQKVGEDAELKMRLEIINLTNSIDVRISKLFDLIESELFACVHSRNTQIAPRQPMIKTNH